MAISLYCWDIRNSQGRVKSRNVAREWVWLIHAIAFPKWTLQSCTLSKWDVLCSTRAVLKRSVNNINYSIPTLSANCKGWHLDFKYHRVTGQIIKPYWNENEKKYIWKKACVLLREGAYIHFSYILFIQTYTKTLLYSCSSVDFDTFTKKQSSSNEPLS